MSQEISRRKMLGATAAVAATAVAGSDWRFAVNDSKGIVKAATDDGADWKPVFLSEKEAQQVAAVCEAIIPKTDTVGARDARVHEYIDLALSVEGRSRQNGFRQGLKWLDDHCKKTTGERLQKASGQEVALALQPLSDEHESHPDNLKKGASFFRDMKTRTIFGYYTSEQGRVEELGGGSEIGMETYQGCPHPGHEH